MSQNLHLFSIDFEEWFTTSYYEPYILKTEDKTYLIDKLSYQILDILKESDTKCTFFMLGSIAQIRPQLLKDIINEGHELASHGFSHKALHFLTPESFEKELILTNKIIEDATGKKVKGFRAPYFSLSEKTSWAIDVLTSLDFVYDSSVFPMKTPLYGSNKAPQNIYHISSSNIYKEDPNAKLIEFPMTIYKNKFLHFPYLGGIYSRFMPEYLLKILILNQSKNKVLNFFFHPWEANTLKPKHVKIPPLSSLLAHYNSNTYLKKIENILGLVNFTSFEFFLENHENTSSKYDKKISETTIL